MKLYRVIQKNFSLLGIVPKQSKSSRKKLAMTSSIHILDTTSSLIFLVFKANTFIEYVNNIYVTTTGIMMSICFANIAVKSDKLFDIINGVEKFVDESECVFWMIHVELLLKLPNCDEIINMFFRIYKYKIERNLCQNQSKNEKMVENCIFYNGEIVTNLLDIS